MAAKDLPWRAAWRGRSILAKRLVGRGFSGALVAGALTNTAPQTCMPAGLVAATTTAASLSVGSAAKGLFSANIIALTDGVLKAMHGMAGSGYFHLILTDEERYSRCFPNVYFGTGDNVLREKTW